MISSTVSSIVQITGPSVLGGGDFDFYASEDFQTIFFGTISNGLPAELTGEDGALRKCPVDIFSERASMRRERQGAAIGLAVSALNHEAHRMSESKIALDCEKCQKYIEEASRKGGNTDLQKHKEEAVSLKKWVKLYESKTFEEIIHEMPNSTGMPGGPKVRYVINPYDGNVMDMRHVMVVGFIYGRIVGDVVENLQSLTPRTSPSAYDAQDWYSNDIGARYYNYRFRTRGFSGKSKNFAQGFSNWLYYDNK